MSFLFINKTLRLDNLKGRRATNAKISVFVICVEAIIYLLLHNLHDCTFKKITPLVSSGISVKRKFLWFIRILRKLHAWKKSGSEVITVWSLDRQDMILFMITTWLESLKQDNFSGKHLCGEYYVDITVFPLISAGSQTNATL